MRKGSVAVHFGGSYRECWTESQRLYIAYEDRKTVHAVRENGVWLPAGGDEELCALLRWEDCPWLTMEYFQAAASVYAAAHICLENGLELTRMREVYREEDNPLAAAELARLLMDDCGFSLEEAYRIAARCCGNIRACGVDVEQVYPLQPRTAHVVSLLRALCSCTLELEHDPKAPDCRAPFGAVCAGEKLRLGFRVLGGQVKSAELVLFGDELRREYAMERETDGFFAQIALPDAPAALWYLFKIESASGTQYLCPDDSGLYGRLSAHEQGGFRLTVYKPGFDTPAWFRRSVMYQIFPDRFAFSEDGTAQRGIDYHRALGQTPELHGSIDEPVRWQAREFERDYSPDDFYGGTFKGIESRLDYLKALGVSVIYLNPIVEARSNHRYDTANYLRPDPILGTEEDFESLCRSAKERGIGIMLDGVFSHTGADSVYFNRNGAYPGLGACQGRESACYGWYDFRSFPDDYRCWWGFRDLPEVNENDPHWQDFVISGENSVVKTWLRRGACGWRLDVADELPDNVLALIRDAAKQEKPDAPILGEVWEDAVIKESYGGRRNYALGYSLDSVMNYPFRQAAIDFARGRMDAYVLRDFLIGQQMNYPKPMYYALMNLLGSHDVERLCTALSSDIVLKELPRNRQLEVEYTQEMLARGRELSKLCAALQFVIPGVPSVYYGDEQGMTGVRDPFNRQPFKEQDGELCAYYQELAALRNSTPILSTGKAEFLAAGADVLLVLRYIDSGLDEFGESAENGAWLAAINRGESRVVKVDCSKAGLGEQSVQIDGCSAKIIKLS